MYLVDKKTILPEQPVDEHFSPVAHLKFVFEYFPFEDSLGGSTANNMTNKLQINSV